MPSLIELNSEFPKDSNRTIALFMQFPDAKVDDYEHKYPLEFALYYISIFDKRAIHLMWEYPIYKQCLASSESKHCLPDAQLIWLTELLKKSTDDWPYMFEYIIMHSSALVVLYLLSKYTTTYEDLWGLLDSVISAGKYDTLESIYKYTKINDICVDWEVIASNAVEYNQVKIAQYIIDQEDDPEEFREIQEFININLC